MRASFGQSRCRDCSTYILGRVHARRPTPRGAAVRTPWCPAVWTAARCVAGLRVAMSGCCVLVRVDACACMCLCHVSVTATCFAACICVASGFLSDALCALLWCVHLLCDTDALLVAHRAPWRFVPRVCSPVIPVVLLSCLCHLMSGLYSAFLLTGTRTGPPPGAAPGGPPRGDFASPATVLAPL